MNLDDIKDFLPKYLTPASTEELYKGLNQFPDNISKMNFYTSYLKNDPIIYQGDCIKDMIVVNLPATQKKEVPAIIISNTCDADLNNSRNYQSHLVYSPIINLNSFKQTLLVSGLLPEKVDELIYNIKKQRITSIFYLPKYDPSFDESIIFFDRIYNIGNTYINRNDLNKIRIFSLSNYGHYLFLIKFSMHYTRFNEKVDRKSFNQQQY